MFALVFSTMLLVYDWMRVIKGEIIDSLRDAAAFSLIWVPALVAAGYSAAAAGMGATGVAALAVKLLPPKNGE